MNTNYMFSVYVKFIRVVLLLVLFGNLNNFAQVVYTKYSGNPVLAPGSNGEWDDSGFAGLCIVYDNATYKIWYGASDGTTFRIGYATSLDGIDWTKYDDPSTPNPPFAESDPVLNLGPGAFESVWVYFPIVYFDGSIYHMWYAGTDGITDRIGYATSPNGITWTKDTLHNPVINIGSSGSWDDAAVDPGPILYNGSEYEMIYNGYDGFHYQGGYATSINGFDWEKDTLRNPVLTVGCDTCWDYPRVQPSSVVYNSNTSKYYLYYSGGELLNWRIGYATSTTFNGPWIKNDSVLIDTTQGGWDSDVTAFPYAIYDLNEGIYKMWYVGGSISTGGAIGYATAPTITGIFKDKSTPPSDFSLEQNYPNPFNPSTKIKYSVPQTSQVQLKVFDVLGEEIETLVNEEKPAGNYELTWNAANLPSGVYFYQLKAKPNGRQAGYFIQTKKMILLK